jgi:hypothetical protein
MIRDFNYAAGVGNLALVENLIESETKLNPKEIPDILNSAAGRGYLEIIKRIINAYSCDVEKAGHALRSAAINGHYKTFKYLFSLGFDPRL